jgi:cyclic beta-1,2-glucan synthetase
VTAAAEWLLDNYHLVASEIRDVRQNLPRDYYRELPKLATRSSKGDARVYVLAVELVRHSDSRLDRQQLVRFLSSYQAVAPLTIGELWAWPSMLKLALIENLRRLAEEATGAREAPGGRRYVARIDAAGHGGRRRSRRRPTRPSSCSSCSACASTARGSRRRAAVDAHLAARRTTAEEAIRSEHQRQAAAQVSVANVVTSLRLCSDARLEPSTSSP